MSKVWENVDTDRLLFSVTFPLLFVWTTLGGVQQWVPWDRMQREITFKHWNSKCSVKLAYI